MFWDEEAREAFVHGRNADFLCHILFPPFIGESVRTDVIAAALSGGHAREGPQYQDFLAIYLFL